MIKILAISFKAFTERRTGPPNVGGHSDASDKL